MLAWERRELAEMKHDVEEMLRKTQRQQQVPPRPLLPTYSAAVLKFFILGPQPELEIF